MLYKDSVVLYEERTRGQRGTGGVCVVTRLKVV